MIPDARETASMHGPAVASLFAGESIGIAPDATLYYAAWPSWLMDSRYAAEALDWVVAQNEALPDGEKIRVVSVSAAPGNAEMFQNADLWDAAVARAEQAGLLVLTVDGAGVERPALYLTLPSLPGMTGTIPPPAGAVLRTVTSAQKPAAIPLRCPAPTARWPRNTPPGSTATPTMGTAA